MFLTLDHLRIVNDSLANVITARVAGQVRTGTASAAAVKPDPNANATVIAAFEASCTRFEQLNPRPSSLSLNKC
ncbi:hypothetical protein BH11VER1_BH11VER1_15660 [soil metagenome]